MQLPDWFYGIAAILAGVAIGWLTWKKRRNGVREDLYSLIGKSILCLFMIAFGILLLKVGK